MSGRSNGEEPGRGHAVTTRGRGSNSRSDGAPPLSSISIRRAGRGPALNRQGGVRSFRDSSSPPPPFFAYPSGQYYVRVGPPTHTALRTVGPLLTDVRQGAAGAGANCFGERSWEGRDVMLCAGACWGPAWCHPSSAQPRPYGYFARAPPPRVQHPRYEWAGGPGGSTLRECRPRGPPASLWQSRLARQPGAGPLSGGKGEGVVRREGALLARGGGDVEDAHVANTSGRPRKGGHGE